MMEINYESVDVRAPSTMTSLESVEVIEKIMVTEFGSYIRCEISYRLEHLDIEGMLHEFIHDTTLFCDDFSDDGLNDWREFLWVLLNPDEEIDSLSFHIKRNGVVLEEFFELSLNYMAGAA